MSRSIGERSIPNERGRRQERLAKRRANKRSRRNQETDPRVDRITTRSEDIDRETRQTDA